MKLSIFGLTLTPSEEEEEAEEKGMKVKIRSHEEPITIANIL